MAIDNFNEGASNTDLEQIKALGKHYQDKVLQDRLRALQEREEAERARQAAAADTLALLAREGFNARQIVEMEQDTMRRIVGVIRERDNLKHDGPGH